MENLDFGLDSVPLPPTHTPLLSTRKKMESCHRDLNLGFESGTLPPSPFNKTTSRGGLWIESKFLILVLGVWRLVLNFLFGLIIVINWDRYTLTTLNRHGPFYPGQIIDAVISWIGCRDWMVPCPGIRCTSDSGDKNLCGFYQAKQTNELLKVFVLTSYSCLTVWVFQVSVLLWHTATLISRFPMLCTANAIAYSTWI